MHFRNEVMYSRHFKNERERKKGERKRKGGAGRKDGDEEGNKTFQLKFKTVTQRDGMGREEGGGFRMGNTCIPVADSF